jgi:hypothetical protein
MKKTLTGDKTVMKRYGDLLADIKARIRQAQNQAVMSAKQSEFLREIQIVQRIVAQLSWAHNVILIQKLNEGNV